MSRFSTKEKFVARSREIHGDKYDYSKVVYNGCDKKVIIGCPIHGDFEQTPSHHTSGARGCPKCSNPSRLLCGVGVNDVSNIRGTKFYEIWHSMVYRCYGKPPKRRRYSYGNCTVCKEWLILSKFKEWFENPDNGYRKGHQLDKDILVKGNRVYSPDTCCFVPQEINTLFHSASRKKGKYILGVNRKKGDNVYCANICVGGIRTFLGCYKSENEAFEAYREAKELYIRKLAEDYYSKREITKRVYDALMAYHIKDTD